MKLIKTFENDTTEYEKEDNIIIISKSTATKVRKETFETEFKGYYFIFNIVRPDVDLIDQFMVNQNIFRQINYALTTFINSRQDDFKLEERFEAVFSFISFVAKNVSQRLQSMEVLEEE